MKVIVVLSNGTEYEYMDVKDIKEDEYEVWFNCSEGKVRLMFNNIAILIIS
ncbi:hypothetical protein ACWOBH_06190 [Globicatella sanguinis]